MNLNNSGCTSSNRKLKGFTLIEMLIVIAIIGIIAGMMSIVMRGFRRDAMIETQNDNARMVFTAFQDFLIDCEIKQDLSMFDVRGELSNPAISAKGAVVFFRVSETASNGTPNKNGSAGLGDEIHIMTAYSGSVPNGGIGGQANIASGSVWIDGTTQNVGGHSGYNDYSKNPNTGVTDGGAYLWDKWNSVIGGRIDRSMTGTYVVMIDLNDYVVRSVICRNLVEGRDPKTGLYDPSEVGSGISLSQFATQADHVRPIGGGSTVSLPCRMFFIENMSKEKEAAERGVYIGCYPFAEDAYESVS